MPPTLLALGGHGLTGETDNYGRPATGPRDVAEAYDVEGGSWSAAEPMATWRQDFGAVAGP